MASQLKMQDQLARRADSVPKQPSERSFNGSSAFADFIKARDRRMRMGSLYEPMYPAAPTVSSRSPPPYPPQQSMRPHLAQQFMPPADFGQNISKQFTEAKRPGLTRLQEVLQKGDIYRNFKAWGLRFLQKLVAAQRMSGGD
ncbi:hypothetical protein PHMEG_00011237 [Phytophthora megakarya]|uniref:Uncharacterized protein n=1 Tax=Phytophthora megakarya TaxID=4795 RepID=A0A225WBR4_9STRA|nr:hypothetical protein PHMEG_00011237 [Phytophthora megakarya]